MATAIDAECIVQIVPKRTSRSDGIGDYAVHLAQGLSCQHGLETVFVSGTPDADEPRATDGWPTYSNTARNSEAFLEALGKSASNQQVTALVLHVSGYGYAKRGAPLWLLRAMREWRVRKPSINLIAILHELYAQGSPANSSFWLGPLQRHVAKGLWNLADAGLTTNSVYRDELIAWRPEMADSLALMPVPSNVGEPEQIVPFHERPSRAAVFGTSGNAAVIYERHGDRIADIIDAHGIDEIVDIGSRQQAAPERIGNARVRACGRLAADEVSDVLMQCRLGLIAYDAARLGKSTIFGAYAAHGVVPVCLSSTKPTDGLIANRHLLLPLRSEAMMKDFAVVQPFIRTWYNQHSKQKLAATIAAMCRKTSQLRTASHFVQAS